MRKLKGKFGLAGLLIIGLVTAGCIVVSGTFIIVKDFELTAQSGFYFYAVDITKTVEWQDHKDDIAFVDAVGMKFVITNNTSTDVTFNCYIDDPGTSSTTIPGTASVIIENFNVPPGTHTISYAQSLTILRNLDRLKKLVFNGKFNYYGTSTANDGSEFLIESGVIIVTLSGSKS